MVELSQDREEAASLYHTLEPDISLVDEGFLRRGLTINNSRHDFKGSLLVRMTRYGSSFGLDGVEMMGSDHQICLDDPIPTIRNEVQGICREYMASRHISLNAKSYITGGAS